MGTTGHGGFAMAGILLEGVLAAFGRQKTHSSGRQSFHWMHQ